MRNGEYPYLAKRRTEGLIATLREAVRRDPEQEVQGMAVLVLDAVIKDIKAIRGDDPVVASVIDMITPEYIGLGDPLRVVDALLVAQQLDAAIGEPPAGQY